MTYNKKDFLEIVEKRNSNQPEFLQAIEEVLEDIIPFINENKKYQNKALLERMVEPERVISFRVPWLNDNWQIQVNRGFRIEFNSAIGPYKGGLRFHPSVNESILKFLWFEQVFKNALTTLPMWGWKGGSDFDPKWKSDNEIMKFCQSFMIELYRHIWPNTDVPAGDIGVWAREIGYLFWQYKRIRNEFTGILTWKGLEFGGSLIRPEATGYGLVYFVEEVLKNILNDNFIDKKVLISGSWNVAQFAAEKVIELGWKVLTMSDSSWTIYDKCWINKEKLEFIKELKNNKRWRIKEYIKEYKDAIFVENKKPWDIKEYIKNINIDIALPCATQNEIIDKDAKKLVKSGVKIIAEGANMPSTPEAINTYKKENIIYVPWKASNAGWVAVSGLEMTQNSLKYSWTKEKVDEKLKTIMKDIYKQCQIYGKNKEWKIDFVKGANIAWFVKVADAMLAQGIV